jgi:hypothetical protein
MAEIVARTKPGKMVPLGTVRGLHARYGLRPPVVKVKPVQPPKPARKPPKRIRKKRYVGRTYDAAVAYSPARVETDEDRLRRIMNSVPKRLEPIKPPDGSLF